MQKINYTNLAKYEILNGIGEGSFGDVFLIRNKKTNQFFAAKISKASTSDKSEKEKEEMENEIKIISQLNHPSILKFIGYNPLNFKKEEKPVILTEYIPNGSLRNMINLESNNSAPHEWNNTKKLINLYGIATGMGYLHSCKILHRDLKPENILLDIYLYPKISDFGLSKEQVNSLDSTSNFKGTFLYFAPEIFEDIQYSQKSDVYAFSLTAYELLTGEKPFSGLTVPKIMTLVKNGKRPQFNSSISKLFKNLIERCWSQEPKNRPSFDEIAKELRTKKGYTKGLENTQEFYDYIDLIDNKIKEPKIKPININSNETEAEPAEEEEEEEDDNDDDDENGVEEEEETDRICPENIYQKLNSNSRALIKKADVNCVAQYSVALNFFDGNGKYPKNQEIALKYLLRSIENGCEDAVVYYYEKVAVDKNDLSEAKKFIKNHQGDDGPTIDLFKGMFYTMKEDYERAFNCFTSGFKKNSSRCAFQLGVFYRDGLGVEKSGKISSDYFVMAKKLKTKAQEESTKTTPNAKQKPKKQSTKSESTNPESLYQKGMKCKNSKGKKDLTSMAIKCFEKASNLGHVKSMEELFEIYYNGIKSIEFNYQKARKYAKMAADKGEIDMMKNYAIMCENGEGLSSPNLEEAIKYFKMAADKGDIDSMNKYALMLDQGEGVKMNKKMACKYFKKAADEGNKDAMYNYALMLINGEGVDEIDIDGAIPYLKKAVSYGSEEAKEELKRIRINKIKNDAKNGDVEAMYKYGMMLIEGKNVKLNKESGVKFLKRAAKNGNKEAKTELKRIEVAEIRQNIQDGDTKAMIKFAKMLIEGKIVKRNLKKAEFFLNQAIELNDKEARIELNQLKEIQLIELNDPKEMVQHGKNLEFNSQGKKNQEEALKWYKRAADLNFVLGMVNYARVLSFRTMEYRNALKNHKKTKMTKEQFDAAEAEVLKYYKKAADKGNRAAMFHYGLCLEFGNGIKIDKKKAVEFYISAAKKGQGTAMSSLGRCYEHGIGVDADEHEALKWYKLAIKHGCEKAKGEYKYLLDKMKKNKKEEEEEDDDDDDDDELVNQNEDEEEEEDNDEINDDDDDDDDDDFDENSKSDDDDDDDDEEF